jgi:hypothetical protein
VTSFAFAILGIMIVTVVIYSLIAAGRAGETLFWTTETKEEFLEKNFKRDVPLISLLTPIIPLVLFFGFNYFGIKIDFIPAFIIG